MKLLKFYATISIILFANILPVQTIKIDGNSFLENQTKHDSIIVVFERIAPSALKDTSYTDIDGHFSHTIPSGIYNIKYSKSGYIDILLTGRPLYSNTILPDTILESIGLSGHLSGTLSPDTYKIGGNIKINNGDTLTISPGTIFKFKGNLTFEINGLLIADGKKYDSIIFTANDTSQCWGGIKFNNSNSNSRMSYCKVEKSDSCGVHIFNTSPYLHNMTINDNKHLNLTENNIGDDGGGGIYFENSNTILDSVIITNNFCTVGGGIYCKSGYPQIKNSIISKNGVFYEGGGAYLFSGSNISFENVKITDSYSINNYEKNADGIDGRYFSKCRVTNSLIANNQGRGIAVTSDASNNSQIDIINSIIYNNLRDGIYFFDTKINVTNSIIADNKEYGIDYSSFQTCTFDHIANNNVYNNSYDNYNHCSQWVGKNVTVNANADSCDAYYNIQKNPMFVDALNEDFHLQGESPCIDAGVNDSLRCAFDLGNNNRIYDGNNNGIATVDIGAYEFGSISVSIKNDHKFKNNFINIYPNPAHTSLTIETNHLAKECTLTISNINGQEIKRQQIRNSRTRIDVSDLTSGVYFVKLISDKEIEVRKIIIE